MNNSDSVASEDDKILTYDDLKRRLGKQPGYKDSHPKVPAINLLDISKSTIPKLGRSANNFDGLSNVGSTNSNGGDT